MGAVEDRRRRGSIVSRGPDRWLVRWYAGCRDDGSRIYKSKTVYGTRAQAEGVLEQSIVPVVAAATKHIPSEFLNTITGTWNCTRCGDCCEQIPLNRELSELGFDRGDGRCVNLREDRSCAIYADRPKSCRVPVEKLDHARQARACAFVRNLVARQPSLAELRAVAAQQR